MDVSTLFISSGNVKGDAEAFWTKFSIGKALAVCANTNKQSKIEKLRHMMMK
jgi:hypothetical protein